ncbi:MAG: hypothetical protein PUD44_08625 [Clostridiaceae bacterium]|nr:hypothetical protein [Clostridiales bacterium]MDD6877825.1 hypothetical protein [Clostridiaceae bacterium]
MTHIFYNGTYSASDAVSRYRRMAGLDSGPLSAEAARVDDAMDARCIGDEFLRFYGRTMDLAQRCSGGRVPAGVLDGAFAMKIAGLFGPVGRAIDEGRMSDALDTLEAHAQAANLWLDAALKKPGPYTQTIYNAVQIAVNLALLYEPFLPRTAQSLRRRLGFSSSWQFSSIPAGTLLTAG